MTDQQVVRLVTGALRAMRAGDPYMADAYIRAAEVGFRAPREQRLPGAPQRPTPRGVVAITAARETYRRLDAFYGA